MLKIIKQYWEWGFQGLCYAVVITAIVMLLGSLCGCGHNVYWEREITGIRLDIPMGDGTLGFAIGCDKSIKATMRGGASFETSSSNGGGLFSGSGGQSKITQFKSHAQLNEGNLVKVFCSSNVPDAAKVVLASNLAAGVNAPYFPGSILQTKESTIHIGRAAIQSNAVDQIQSTRPQGLDLVVDKTGDVVHDVVNPFEGTVREVKGTVKEAESAIATTSKEIKDLLRTLILVIVGALLVVSLIAILVSKSRKSKKKIVIDTGLQEEDTSDATKPMESQSISPTAAALPELPAPSTEPKPSKKGTEKTKVKTSSFKSFCEKTVGVIKTIIKYINLIPAPIRKKIVDKVVTWWKQRQAAKQQKKTK